MTTIHPWQPNESYRLVIRHLAQGDCVALPTESTYEIVASALDADAIARFPEHNPNNPPAFVFGEYASLFDWLPLLRGAGARLFRKLGAGAITLQANAGYPLGLWSRLPAETRRILVQDDLIAVRWPSHPIWDELRQAGLPLVSQPIEAANDAESATQWAGDRISCLLDAGATPTGSLPTLVQADGARCRLIREGGVTSEQLELLTLCRVMFICTGNTCRSPMAESLCIKLLAEALECSPTDLPRRGFSVQSAGLAAMTGSAASPDAAQVVADFGAELARHRSRPATLDMLQWADHVFAMTASHAYALSAVRGIPEPRLLSPDDDDVADPIGGTLADYRACAEQIIQCLRQRLPELLES